jgi:hypothetical protein
MPNQRSMIAAILMAAGCASPGAPFPVLGDRRQLEGQWEGSFEGAQTGRSGSIVFRFGGGTDSAYGSVLMIPSRDGTRAPLVSTLPESPSGPARVLRITYVWCGSGEVTGRLDPYEDPITGERVYTMFEGRLTGDVLSGSFSTLYADRGHLLEGTWSARKRKP